jgi:acyl-homoserine-lactone acylase
MKPHPFRWLAVWGTAAAVAVSATIAAAPATASTRHQEKARYQATIVRTAYGVPHITARDFGSLGFGYGFALASDNLCTMAQTYVTVQGDRSRYFGPDATVPGPGGGEIPNVLSDIYWRSVIASKVLPRLLAVRTGVSAVGPHVRQLMTGYVAGYNNYLASVGGSQGVPDPTCRGQAWVKPITLLDAYLLVYQLGDIEGLSSEPDALATAQPPGTHALLTAAQLSRLGQQEAAGLPDTGSNAIAIGSAGTRNHRGMLLGNPHLPWLGALRLYQVQLTIPGTVNIEGATIIGVPLVVIGFNSSMAWSETTSRSHTVTPYQLTLVPATPPSTCTTARPWP